MNWKRWWHTPPNEKSFLFTRIRLAFQYFIKCDHIWTHDEYFVHGESHGYNFYKRRCRICNQKQRFKYHSYGKLRYEWKDEFKIEDLIL